MDSKMKRFTAAAEFDGCESGGSSSAEEFETSSPKSVSRYHRRVLRIREEESHLGEDIGEGLSTKDDKHKLAFLHLRSNLDAFLKQSMMNTSSPSPSPSEELLLLFCNKKPMLPASPLSGTKTTAITSFH